MLVELAPRDRMFLAAKAQKGIESQHGVSDATTFLVEHDGENIDHHCRLIFDREGEADEVMREVLTAVRRTASSR
jgi:hypothetical protein